MESQTEFSQRNTFDHMPHTHMFAYSFYSIYYSPAILAKMFFGAKQALKLSIIKGIKGRISVLANTTQRMVPHLAELTLLKLPKCCQHASVIIFFKKR